MPKLFNNYRYENFLDKDFNSGLINYCIDNKDAFTDAMLGFSREEMAINTNYRICKINNDLGPYKTIFENVISDNFNDFCEKLKIMPFKINGIELQIAAHGDGAFFKQHIDTHTELQNNSKNRVISAVYYFFNEPKQFEGGELVLHPFSFMDGDDNSVTFSPMNNSLIIW